MRCLGIDPGLRITGYGCVEGSPDQITTADLVEGGVVRLVKSSQRDTPSVASRLVELERDLLEIFDRLEPDLVAVEGLFAHGKHPATAITMAHARGVILLIAERLGIPLVELKPALVKSAMTGNGAATKAQMQEAVARAFGLAEPPKPADVADALAIALAGLRRGGADADRE